MTDPILETTRLHIRPLERGDLDALATVLSDSQTMRFYTRPFTRAEVSDWIVRNRRRYRDEGLGLWALELKESGRVVGNCGPVRQEVDGRKEIELGWHVHRELWGQGLATEAALAVRDHCHIELGIARLIALVRPINLQSGRVAEKIGMTVERETFWGGYDHLIYSRTREDKSS
jgi:[ribosomal protein S5]-alanine N-acetyltransferase